MTAYNRCRYCGDFNGLTGKRNRNVEDCIFIEKLMANFIIRQEKEAEKMTWDKKSVRLWLLQLDKIEEILKRRKEKEAEK
jgi:hypothetical protein